MEIYLDSTKTPGERAQDLLGRLSLEEKMAQVQCILIPLGREKEAAAYLHNGIGEVSTLDVRRIETLEEAAKWQRSTQQTIMENSRLHIPAIFHMEGLCGALIQDAVSFPCGIGRGSSFDSALEEKIGKSVARQELAVGITHTLAPVLDISRDSRMGRQGESYGEDATLAAQMGTAYAAGIQSETVGGRRADAVAKHYMGFHNSLGGIHGAASETPRRLLREVYGKPFQAAIARAKMRGVMPCYCTIDGEPASSSKWLLTDVLRTEMGFDGVAVSDYGAVSNIHNVQNSYESLEEAGYAAMQAGMDVEMPIRSAYNENLAKQFADGRADIAVLDTCVLRVLTAKFRMGLFEEPYAMSGEALAQAFYSEEDRQITLQSARESLVLLKNEDVLPLAPSVKKIALIGPHAANARSFFGGYTHISMVEAMHAVANSIAGIEDAANNETRTVPYVPGTQIQSSETEEFDAVLRHIKPECRSLYEELTARLPEAEIVYAHGYHIAGDDTSGFAEALAACADADVCILTLGGKNGSCSVASMGEGVDSTDINLPACQDAFLLEAAKLNKPLIGVHLDGRPISSDAADAVLDAILEAWSPSEMGAQAIVETLLGENNPSGRLPVSVARTAGQIPVFYNHPAGSCYHQGESIGFANYVNMPHTPRYFFGHGLSYTTFAYRDLQLDTKEVAPDGCVHISVTVENTGNAKGTEVVQLYVKDTYAQMTRPVLELAGFARVLLAAGEQKRVTFKLYASQLAFLDREERWLIERGEICVMVGASSDDLRLSDAFTITESSHIEGRERAFWADVQE